MGHNVGDQANRAVKKGERRQPEEKRTPEQRLADIRKNLDAKLFVIPDDQRFLLGALDAEREFNHKLAEESMKLKELNASQSTMITDLQAQVDQFRAVYDQENRNMVVEVAVDVLRRTNNDPVVAIET